METPALQAAGQAPHDEAHVVAGCLTECLARLDRFDSGLAAVHLSMALETLKRDYRLTAEG